MVEGRRPSLDKEAARLNEELPSWVCIPGLDPIVVLTFP